MSSDLPEDIQSYHDEPCPRCKGAGKNPKDSKLGYPENACYYCDGTGKRPIITVELSESAPKAPSVQNSESDSGDDWLDAILTKLENRVAADTQQRMVGHYAGRAPKSIHAEAKAAIQAQLAAARKEPCPSCNGMGNYHNPIGEFMGECRGCNGTGMSDLYSQAQLDAAYQRGRIDEARTCEHG